MIAVAGGIPETRTSADGSTYRPDPDPTFADVLYATIVLAPATGTTYEVPRLIVGRTTAGPVGEIVHDNTDSRASYIMEIRRRSGLTWAELGDLFGVSRRSVHYWANGQPVSAGHDRTIRRILVAIRYLDQGSQAGTRSLLLAVDRDTGTSTFDLLRDGCFELAKKRVGSIRTLPFQRTDLSDSAQDARRPPSPVLLLGAEQDRPDIPAKARIAQAKRAPGSKG